MQPMGRTGLLAFAFLAEGKIKVFADDKFKATSEKNWIERPDNIHRHRRIRRSH